MPRHHAVPGSQLDAILDRRSAELARPPVADTRGPGLQVIGFTHAGGLYGLPMIQVSEVLAGRPVVRWPGAPPHVLGLVGHSGRTVAVLDLARLLGTAPRGSQEGMLVVLKARERRLALLVDRATGMMRVDPPAGGEDEPVRWAAIREAAPGSPQTLALLDAGRLAAALAGSGPRFSARTDPTPGPSPAAPPAGA